MVYNIFLSFLGISATSSIVIFLFLLFTKRVRHRYEAKWEYYIWLVLIVRLLIPFGPTIPGFTAVWVVPEPTLVTEKIDEQSLLINSEKQLYDILETTSEYNNSDAVIETIDENNSSSISIVGVASFLWLFGFLLFLIFNISVFIHYRSRILHFGHRPRTTIVRKTFEELIATNKSARKLQVLISPEAASPMLLGLIKPVLVLPNEDYTASELQLVLRHELTHYQNHDIMFKIMTMVANAIHWFNPLMYVVSREINNCIELCCDSKVVNEVSYTLRKVYGRAILKSMEEKNKVIPVSTAFGGSVAEMKERINNIFDSGVKKLGFVPLASVLLLTLFSGMMISCVTANSMDVDMQDIGMYNENQTSEQSVLPIESKIAPLISTEKIANSIWPSHEEYLDLHEAVYCINYIRSKEYAVDIPVDDLSEYFYDYVGFERVECAYFGRGVPCDEWQTDRGWIYPFHSSGSDPYTATNLRDAWAILVTNPHSEIYSIEIIYVDAQTGDMYIPTARGGYRPSPFINRSEYSKALNAG